jgi:hypothetical protein
MLAVHERMRADLISLILILPCMQVPFVKIAGAVGNRDQFYKK